MRFAQGKLREGAGSLGRQMLRCAQHDTAGPSGRALVGVPLQAKKSGGTSIQAPPQKPNWTEY